MLLATIKHES